MPLVARRPRLAAVARHVFVRPGITWGEGAAVGRSTGALATRATALVFLSFLYSAEGVHLRLRRPPLARLGR